MRIPYTYTYTPSLRIAWRSRRLTRAASSARTIGVAPRFQIARLYRERGTHLHAASARSCDLRRPCTNGRAVRRPSSSFLRRTHARSRAWIVSRIFVHYLASSILFACPANPSFPPTSRPSLSFPAAKGRYCDPAKGGGGEKCDSVFRQRSAVSAGTYRWCAIESCRVSASVLRWSALWKGHRRKDRLAESRWVARFHQHAFASTLLPCLLWTTCATGVVARGWPLPCEITGVKLSMINSRCEIQSVEKSVLKSEWDLLILELELKNGLKKNRFKSRGSWSLSKVKDVWCAFCRLLLFLVFLEGREGEGN